MNNELRACPHHKGPVKKKLGHKNTPVPTKGAAGHAKIEKSQSEIFGNGIPEPKGDTHCWRGVIQNIFIGTML
jgi:hypothetical protein